MKDIVASNHAEQYFHIESAATSTEEIGNPVYPPARRMLAMHGIGCAGKFARQLTEADYQEYDLLIGMDHANIRNMKRICKGDPESKIKLLMDYAGKTDREVSDPWYTGDFAETWDDVREGCLALFASLFAQN